LDDRELVYAWSDGVYVKAGLEKEKAALLVVIGAMSDGSKEILAVVPGYRESSESWAAVFRGLRDRGLNAPKILVADGNLGAWAALSEIWPTTTGGRCWNHKIVNVLDKLPQKLQPQARELLCEIPYAPTRDEAEGGASLAVVSRLEANNGIPSNGFFLGGCDWYAVEYGLEDRLFFGYAILNDDLLNSEWGVLLV
jgi:transposase-like protein